MQYIKEYRAINPLNGIRTNPNKSAIALFLGELLYKSVKEEEANDLLFHFLVESILSLNDLTCSIANFHLYFLAKFCAKLGIAPLPNFHPEHAPHFDVTQGIFVPPNTYPHTRSDTLFTQQESHLFAKLSALTSAEEAASIPLNGAQRHQFVLQIIRYLHYHLGVSLDVKSPDVLRQLFQ
jgi:DNA repair protein RecO (recombination protein O)